MSEAVVFVVDGRGGQGLVGDGERPVEGAGDREGVRWSPRPVPRAAPPSRANGTSLPSCEARSCSSAAVAPVFHRVLQARRAAAASALPPAIPAATGMSLTMCSRTPALTPNRAASRRAARTARLRSSVGTCAACSPVTVTSTWPGPARVACRWSYQSRARKTVVSGW